MGKLCDWAKLGGGYVIADFVCPTQETRQAFNADFVVWVDRIMEGRYEDTNKMFERPLNYDIRLTDGTPEEWAEKVLAKLEESEAWDTKHQPHCSSEDTNLFILVTKHWLLKQSRELDNAASH